MTLFCALPCGLPGAPDGYMERGRFASFEPVFEQYLPAGEVLGSLAVPAVVAIDGPTNAGKTVFANKLADFYTARGLRVVRLPLDLFLQDRASRHAIYEAVAAGAMDIADYSQAAWEQDRYEVNIQLVRGALTAINKGPLTIARAYDRQTGRKDRTEEIDLQWPGVILTEGVGIHSYHSGLFDLMVRVDVPDDGVLWQRVLGRERQKPPEHRLDEAYLKWRYDSVDAPHTAHLRELSAGRAHVVVDTADFNDMVVYTK
ncbi:MAG TPA: hypothetical protein VF466_00255 [Candidatus Saccharimonadales bacterium]